MRMHQSGILLHENEHSFLSKKTWIAVGVLACALSVVWHNARKSPIYRTHSLVSSEANIELRYDNAENCFRLMHHGEFNSRATCLTLADLNEVHDLIEQAKPAAVKRAHAAMP